MGTRRRAREYALQMLYLWEFHKEFDPVVVEDFWKERPQDDLSTRDFTMGLVSGVLAHLAEIDETIKQCSTNWRIDRMATVDRNILRVATFELQHKEDTPLKVILNEAIELGKRYGSEDSGSFVNGVLDKIGATLRPPSKK